jgi:hypothetical protein
MNINPDHVNLEKGGWKNILSFRTVEKNVLVEIYGMDCAPILGTFL